MKKHTLLKDYVQKGFIGAYGFAPKKKDIQIIESNFYNDEPQYALIKVRGCIYSYDGITMERRQENDRA